MVKFEETSRRNEVIHADKYVELELILVSAIWSFILPIIDLYFENEIFFKVMKKAIK